MITMKGMINMNNRNWIAVFLGLACLVLFVSVMGASGNWLNGNNGENNNDTNPQQINQTIRNMDKNTAPQDGSMPTEIDANGMTNKITDTTNNASSPNSSNNTTDNTNNNEDKKTMEENSMPNLLLPQMSR